MLIKLYLPIWLALITIAICICIKNKENISLFTTAYARYILVKWKLIILFVSLILINVGSWFYYDPTWDYLNGTYMTILTYLTAPWVVGTIYRKKHTYVGCCIALFSCSWSYDAYLLIRDGVYTDFWLINLYMSLIGYILFGLLLNMQWTKDKGMVFGFMLNNWPALEANNNIKKIVLYCMPFVIWLSFLFLVSIHYMERS